MSFWNRFEFHLLAHTLDLSHKERADAVDDLWDNFIVTYLKWYQEIHVENGQVTPQTILSKQKLQSRLRDQWFKPRALRSYKVIHGIDDSADYLPNGKFTWSFIKPGAQNTLDVLFDDLFLKVEQLIHEESVWFYFKSIDCDQCESDGIKRFDSWYEAAQWITRFYDNLEGPGHVTQATLKQYLTFVCSSRDYRAEQYNY